MTCNLVNQTSTLRAVSKTRGCNSYPVFLRPLVSGSVILWTANDRAPAVLFVCPVTDCIVLLVPAKMRRISPEALIVLHNTA